MAAIFHLVYISEAAEDISYTDIREILDVSKKYNAAEGITGLLIFREGYFLQLLEGEEKTVRKILNKILLDDRNYSLNVLLESRSDQRLFPGWEMAFHDADIFSSSTSHILDELFVLCTNINKKPSKEIILSMLDTFKASAPELK